MNIDWHVHICNECDLEADCESDECPIPIHTYCAECAHRLGIPAHN